MEPSEIISQEWSYLSGVYTAQEAEFMTQFLENCSVPEDHSGNANLGFQSSSAFWPTGFTGDSFYFPSNVADATNNFGSISMSREVQVSEPAQEDGKTSNLQNSGKKSRSSFDIYHYFFRSIQKNKRNVKPRRNPESFKSIKEEDRSNGGLHGHNSSSFCSSEDDSTASQEDDTNPKNNKDLNSNSRSRSDRGPATDPQSLYARRRRGRINERLRVLQNLVPNGTKVDMSTMLEEAAQYVKFLQLQIKLLSSDDLWMYAPIVYDGLNIGLDLNFTPTTQPQEKAAATKGYIFFNFSQRISSYVFAAYICFFFFVLSDN